MTPAAPPQGAAAARTKSDLETASGSRPERYRAGLASSQVRGATAATASAMALMCGGDEPQQPPARFR